MAKMVLGVEPVLYGDSVDHRLRLRRGLASSVMKIVLELYLIVIKRAIFHNCNFKESKKTANANHQVYKKFSEFFPQAVCKN